MGLFGRMATALEARRIGTALVKLDAQLASLGRSIVDDVRRQRAAVDALEAARAVEARWRQREAREELERLRHLRARLARTLPPVAPSPPSALDRELEARKVAVREEAREARFRVFDR